MRTSVQASRSPHVHKMAFFIFLVLLPTGLVAPCNSSTVRQALNPANKSVKRWNDASPGRRLLGLGDTLPQEHSASSVMRVNETSESLFPTFQQLASSTRIIIVDQNGGGQFRSVQAAVDSVPINNNQWVYINIGPGIYREKVTIPYNKPFVAFQGAGMERTVITWQDRASGFGTANSARFIAKGVGFRNAAPPPSPGAYGGQAVAVLLNGDMMAFYECGFYGAQDTLFDYYGRHYFRDCIIQGSIDFIFGHAQSIFKGCHLVVTAQSGYISGSITAQNRKDPHDQGGFVFLSCTIMGTGYVYLGRAWGSYSRVVFLNTYMSNIIVPDGWNDWGQPSRQRTVYYGQYQCSGPGANTDRRVPWSRDLSLSEAQPFLELSFINAGAWLQEA
ncbi:hypothetical protein KP509_05G031000 [Ceratopteris richardii]|uniref:Pectinesterase n=1 Tax=Ceratopteris richardii TaxID=49495 RepID=A0A8T2UPJ0_CERRI|nr:hypothetical protein KP509_05G031000 [Ceratopteris richardii]